MDLVLKQNVSADSAPLCPDCELSLRAYRCHGSLLFKCSNCHGVWLSGGRKLGVFRRALEKFNYADLQIYLSPDDDNAYFVSSCANCRQVLEEFHYGYNTGVRLYRCGRCHGMWMPLRQMINLMESLKLTQSVREDVRALASEIRKMYGEAFAVRKFLRALKLLK